MLQHLNFADTAKELGESLVSYDNYQDEAVILHIQQSSDIKNSSIQINPKRFDAPVIIGIDEGEIDIKIDYNTYKATQNSIFIIMPTHITQIVEGKNNVKGWAFVISKTLMDQIASGGQEMQPLISYIQLKKNPMTVFDPEEYKHICESLDFMRQKIRLQSHLFHHDIVLLALKMFFLNTANIYLGKRENVIMPTISRKEEIFVDFLSLLQKNCKNQHDVTFYANKLCITPQYLSATLKEQSGKAASQWIHEALMVEAKVLLKRPRTSVQQVAYELHFPDQSTFGKFFKKREGISPIKFRKSN